MRIVNLETFRTMPPGTFFQKYEPDVYGDLAVLDEVWDVDFLVNHITSYPVGLTMVEEGASLPVSFDFIARDGCFEKDQLFAVWEDNDLHKLIAYAQLALRAGK